MIILLMIRAWAWLLLDFRWAFNDMDFTFPNIVGGRVTSHHNTLKVVSRDDDKELELHYTIFVLSEVSGGMALKTKGFACLLIDLCLQAFGNVYLDASGGGPFMEWDLRPELKWFSNSLVCVKFMEWW